MTDTLLTPAQLSSRWKQMGYTIKPSTLANWRSLKPKKGPKFVRPGKCVFYPMSCVVAWEDRKMKASR